MNLLKFLKSFFFQEEIPNFGILQSDLDNLAPSSNLHEQSEVVAKISLPTFKGVNGDGSIRKFPYQYQSSSSSCVAHTEAKIATILYYLLKGNVVKYSPAFFYSQRTNKPNGGMAFSDVVKIGAKKGCLLYDLMPCNGYSEELMNSMIIEQYQYECADAFKLPENWIELPLDFDTVASTIEATKKPIMLWFQFYSGEFFFTSYPRINGNNTSWKHSITAVDTTTKNGVKYIVIEDSADHEENYQKFINREFFERCFLARYPKNFQFAIPSTTKPVFDGSIKSLQEILIYEGLLPTDCNTGYFGNLTKQALIKFQTIKGISPAIGVFGDITKRYLLTNYQ